MHVSDARLFDRGLGAQTRFFSKEVCLQKQTAFTTPQLEAHGGEAKFCFLFCFFFFFFLAKLFLRFELENDMVRKCAQTIDCSV